MNMLLPDSDTRPWYRHFWLWVLILLPASAVVAGLTTVYIAVDGADDLVVDDYYKDGLAINRVLEKEQQALGRGIAATLSVDKTQVTVKLAGEVGTAPLSLLLSHPLEADHDVTLALTPVAPGVYRASLPRPVAPHWYWVIQPTGPDNWRLDGVLHPSDFGNARND